MDNTAVAFGMNLRRIRKQRGITQEALGEQIGYSEKSVSKWESGKALPPADVLVSLSRQMCCSIDSFFEQETAPEYYLGIDGGGTKTRFALADSRGQIRRTLRLEACNPVNGGVERTTRVLEKGIREICSGIPLNRISVHAGIAGGIYPGVSEAIDRFLSGLHFARYAHSGDVDSILAAGLDGRDGIAVIMGTGSVAYAQRDGKTFRAGGYGYLFDSGGNGYTIGCRAIREALLRREGSRPDSPVAELVEQRVGGNVTAHLMDFYNNGKEYIAGFAGCVFDAYTGGDALAGQILEENMRQVAVLIQNAARNLTVCPVPVVLTGGLTARADILLPMVTAALDQPENYRLTMFGGEPVLGNLMLAGVPAKMEEIHYAEN